jgi:hypothetical protein
MTASKLYSKLCTEYNDKNIQRLCSLQTFLQFKYNNCKNTAKKSLLYEVLNIAANDYAM